MTSAISTSYRNQDALQRGRLLARLRLAGVSVAATESIEIDGGQIYARAARDWRKSGLIGRLRARRYLGEVKDVLPAYGRLAAVSASAAIFEGLLDAAGTLQATSYAQPEGVGAIETEIEAPGAAFYILPASSPAESIRSTPRRPGAPSIARLC